MKTILSILTASFLLAVSVAIAEDRDAERALNWGVPWPHNAAVGNADPLSDVPVASTHSASDGQQLIESAARRIFRQPSIAAKLRLKVDLFGQQLIGTGKYLQLGQGEDKLLRLEMSVQTDDHLTTFQQVADGRFLWLRRDFPDSVDLGRVDLKRLQLELADRSPPNVSRGTSLWMALGGLSKLLSSLAENFQFSNPQPARVAGMEMLALHGAWKPERLAELLPDQPADPNRLPPQFPHRVIVLLGQDDLFPYRVEYLRQSEQSRGNGGRQAKKRPWTVATRLEMYEVRAPATIDPLQFVYKPDATQIEDRTRALIDSLQGPAQTTQP